MRPFVLQTLTWGTVAAAVSSALWLAWADNRGDLPRLHTASRQASASLNAARKSESVMAGLASLAPLTINLKSVPRSDTADWLVLKSSEVADSFAEAARGSETH
jgi:hypothetical protein